MNLLAEPHLALEPVEPAVDTGVIARTPEPASTARPDLREALGRAKKRIAPLWPLESFVAVNPFLGVSDERFEEACNTMMRVAGAHMLMPREHYRTLLAEGRITDDDLREALHAARALEGVPRSVAELREAMAAEPQYAPTACTTMADTVGADTEILVVGEVAKWCASYYDDGQAAWPMPWRHLPLYSAWRASVAIDRTAETLGWSGFREAVAELPEGPVGTIEVALESLGLPPEAWDGYLFRALFSVRGWAAYARYVGWPRELGGEDHDAVLHVLAVRLAWDYAMFRLHGDAAVSHRWKAAVQTMSLAADQPTQDPELLVDAILQGAVDASYRRALLSSLGTPDTSSNAVGSRKALQAAFCIDVRSEVFRRHLETVAPQAETIGFAGFFGFPIEYVPIGQSTGPAHCPVLIEPKFVVRETVAGADEDETTEILGLRLLRRRAAKAWKSFKQSAVSSFVFVETIGLGFAAKLVGDATGKTRPVTDPSEDGLDPKVVEKLAPEVAPGALAGRDTGFTHEQRVDVAETVLRAMSLTRSFARLVMLTGHGSTTVNNPHAAGYDCGACGGHPGDANARVGAAVLNDPQVRAALVARGITIPEDTWFLGGLHDTTTDQITVFDRDQVPASHADDLATLDAWLAEASSRARRERATLLHTGSGDVEEAIVERSRDWSQVRPEWGLARNAAFIAAPRARTRGIDLDGRVFLHDYDWRDDHDWGVLELIMTAPVVVASWINLQYYGSSVDREAFSSGNKVLHNVVGTLGVLEGNGGDLRVGLPWQSLHDGHRLVHEPIRLNVFIEAPTEQIDAILEKHANVRELVDHGWLHLLAIGESGNVSMRDATDGTWRPVAGS